MSETYPLSSGSTPPVSPTSPQLRPQKSNSPLNPFSSKPPSREPSLNYLSADPGTFPSRGSMVLYRLASEEEGNEASAEGLLPPKFTNPDIRSSVLSNSSSNRSSIVSLDGDSKYPYPFSSGLGANTNSINRDSTMIFRERGLVPYAYDPEDDVDEEDDDEKANKVGGFPWRGFLNVGMLLAVVLALLMLFIFLPVWVRLREDDRLLAIDGNVRINATGQAPVLFGMPSLIDADTPEDARTRTGFDGEQYNLVFSDEFEKDGRTFYPGDDPFWEAVDLWYGVTGDLEWYDPAQIITKNGSLVITMDAVGYDVRSTDGSTAPITPADSHEMNYRSGMLQSWNKFCFTGGYVEVAIVLPGASEAAEGYWPGAWTMGNLGRPGYPATTDGMWPYTYDSCDVGTFPNQSYPDGSGPPAAVRTDWGRTRYNNELSWLTGQRLSACSCVTDDANHPGPQVRNETSGEMRYRGRGAPEIDILEAERDKHSDAVQHVVSQSAQFAPFTRDYIFFNATDDLHRIYDPELTTVNSYRGSAVQQAVSSLTRVPSDGFQGTGRRFVTYGFEYEPGDSGSITWQVDGSPSHRLGAGAMAADPIDQIIVPNTLDANGQIGMEEGSGLGGTGVSQRLVPVEPMSIIFNLGISPNWQTIDLASLIFPAEMLVDYVRVYQKASEDPNVSCDPEDYPTASYITNHPGMYENKNKTVWEDTKPRNRLYDGC